MLPYITILGRIIPTYGILGFLGIAVAICFGVFYFSKSYDIKKEDIFYCTLFALIGIGIGAKLLYILTITPYLIQNFNIIDWKTAIPMLLQGGFVFYGGLIGGILGIYVYSKAFKVSFKKLCMTLVPTVPIFHSIGRIGCLLAGCCYGMEYNGFGSITFYNSNFAPIGVPLFPIQIVESICNLIIFILILLTYKKFKGTYKTIGLYFVLYSIVRFILEFFRGDAVRGIIVLSTSQWISIAVFIVGILLFIYSYKDKKKVINSKNN